MCCHGGLASAISRRNRNSRIRGQVSASLEDIGCVLPRTPCELDCDRVALAREDRVRSCAAAVGADSHLCTTEWAGVFLLKHVCLPDEDSQRFHGFVNEVQR